LTLLKKKRREEEGLVVRHFVLVKIDG